VHLTFWLELATPAEVPVTLIGYYSSTSSISAKASISWPSTIFGMTWVDGVGAASSPDHKKHWLSLLAGIVRVDFLA
jgi:hypothetical protein